MTTIQEQRLSLFVNRTAELTQYLGMLQGGGKPVMVLWGGSGIGKSSLMARMVHECAQTNTKKAEVIWTDTRNHNYLGIMRKIRDDIGADAFRPFTDLINYYTVPQYELKISYVGGSIQVAEGARIESSNTGDIAGIVIKDVMLNAPRPDMDIPEDERRMRLTDLFLECLATATHKERLVVFFDAVEKMSPDTEKWVCNELVAAISAGRLPNVMLILCGQKRLELGESWLFAEEAELKPLSREHVIEYLAKRGVDQADREALATMLMVVTKGKLADIANYVEGFLRLQKNFQTAQP